jgi:hypothetical protein
MIYKELLQQLQQLTEEQLNTDVCVYDRENHDEYYQVGLEFINGARYDVVDVDYPIIHF